LCVLTDKEVQAVIIHEIYHLLHGHLKRAKEDLGRYDKDVENISMDLAINQFIPNMPEGTINMKNFAEMFDYNINDIPEKEAYEVYEEMAVNSKNYKEKKEQIKKQQKELLDKLESLSNKLQGNSGGEYGEEGEEPDDDGEGSSNGKKGSLLDQIEEIMKELNLNGCGYDQSDPDQIERMEEIIGKMAEEVAQQMGKARGNLPSHIQELIKKLNEPPKIRWEDEFRRMVGRVKKPYKKTPLRRDRRQQSRYDLRGRISDRVVNLAIAFDTSGSMTEKEFSYIFTEVFEILKTTKYTLTVIECDAKIQRVYEVNKKDDVEFNVQGRGGTAFQPIFEYVNENLKNNNLNMLCIFTDGYGERSISEEFKPKGYELMWVITGDESNLSVEDPWTTKVRALHIDD
jgi:predicted metal-dependent peptidase